MSLPESTPPLSLLVLEQYALGELSAERRHEVEARLAQSAADRAALDAIEQDVVDLPPLPDFVTLPRVRPVQAGPPAGSPVHPLRPPARRARWAWAAAPVLAAAAALLLWRVEPGLPPPSRALKGGELALRVVSDRGGDATTFAEGERLKLLVTCPPDLSGTLATVVFQGGERFEPLPEAHDFACGNGVPWPGAFQLDGAAPVHVCVGDARAVEQATVPEDLGERAVCATLRSR